MHKVPPPNTLRIPRKAPLEKFESGLTVSALFSNMSSSIWAIILYRKFPPDRTLYSHARVYAGVAEADCHRLMQKW